MSNGQDIRIWDLHCHLPSRRVAGETLSDQIARMLEIGARLGIERIGVFLRTGRSTQGDREIERALETHRGRALGFVWCSLPDTRQSVDDLRRWVGDGPMVGLKLGGGSGVCSKPEYDPVFAKAVELDAVIYQHTWLKIGGDPPVPGGGNLPRESTPADLVTVARRYPDYPFICGHTGGDWELGIRAAAPQPNVCIGIGGGYPSAGMVEMGVRDLGAHRVIYGSDVTGRSFASQLGKVWGAALTDTQRQAIFRDNLRRLMKPILEAKGIDAACAATRPGAARPRPRPRPDTTRGAKREPNANTHRRQ